MITSKEWRHWLRTLGYPQPQRAPRRSPVGLAAMYGSVRSPQLGHIKVISRNGLFLQTEERWPIGEIVSLTLQKEDAAVNDSQFQIEVQARVASYGDDGVGMGFVLPKGLNSGLWEHVVDTADTEDESEDTQFIFRMIRSILWLYRLCPSRATEPIYAITGELDEFRTRNMLTIALIAEKMLAEGPDPDKMRADAHIVASILKDGSWEHDDLTQRLWAGMLVSSCDLTGLDQSNLDLVELLVQVTSNQLHILVEACRRAAEQPSVIVDHEEMIRITGMYDLYRNATDVAYLHNYGLIENNFDFSTHGPKGDFDITPTPLGIRLFKTCLGHLIEEAVIAS